MAGSSVLSCVAGVATDIGDKRENQDKHLLSLVRTADQRVLLFAAVFDGHGKFGDAAAIMATRHVQRSVEGSFARQKSAGAAALSGESGAGSVRSFLERVPLVVHQEIAASNAFDGGSFDPELSGTTACICAVEIVPFTGGSEATKAKGARSRLGLA